MIFKKKILSLLTLALCLAVGSFAYIHSLHAAEEEVDLTTSTPKLIQEVKTNVYSSTTPNGDLNLEGLENDEGIVPESVPQEKMTLDPNDILQKIDDDLYRHPKLGYTFKSPQNWNVYQIPSMSYVRVENLNAQLWSSYSDIERRNYYKIEIVALPASGLSLDDWVGRQNTFYPQPIIHEQGEMEIDGLRAIYQLEQFGSHTSPAIFLLKEGTVYIINPSRAYEKFKETTNEFITNLTFNK